MKKSVNVLCLVAVFAAPVSVLAATTPSVGISKTDTFSTSEPDQQACQGLSNSLTTQAIAACKTAGPAGALASFSKGGCSTISRVLTRKTMVLNAAYTCSYTPEPTTYTCPNAIKQLKGFVQNENPDGFEWNVSTSYQDEEGTYISFDSGVLNCRYISASGPILGSISVPGKTCKVINDKQASCQ